MGTHSRVIVMLLASVLAGCGYTRVAEERTDDGLVRVPSRASGGVYRDPAADFTPFKRIILEPPTIEFTTDWREAHPEVKDAEVRRIRDEAVRLFREQFTRELVDRGNFELTDTLAPDVLLIAPRVVDLDIPAPEANTDLDKRSYTPGPVRMQITGDVRSAVNNNLLMRVIIFEGQSRYGNDELRLANRSTNAHELLVGFGKWSKMLNEALNVAKAMQPGPATAQPAAPN